MGKNPPSQIGMLLRQSREAVGMSQRALAQQVGLDVSYINRLESGERRPRRQTLLKLASALGITGQELDNLFMAGDLAPMPLLAGLSAPKGQDTAVSRIGESAPAHDLEAVSLWNKLEAIGLDEGSIRRLLQAMESAEAQTRNLAAAAISSTLKTMATFLTAPVHRAVIPAAGGQHRLLAFHIMQRLLLQTMAEAASAGICQFMLILAPGTAEALHRPLQIALDLAAAPRFTVDFCVQSAPRGLGDAVLQAASWVGEENFLVLLPDEMLDRRYSRDMPRELQHMSQVFAQLHHAPLFAVEPAPKSRLLQGGVVRLGAETAHPRVFLVDELREKPAPQHPISEIPSSRSIVGRYFLRPEIFQTLDFLKNRHTHLLELTDALEHLRQQRTEIYAYELKTSRRDLGGVIERAEDMLGEL